MKPIPEFLQYFIHDILNTPEITYKRVLSGYAIYYQNKIFAIFVFGEIYFKQNQNNKKDFDKYNSKYFTYSRKDGKIIQMKYRLLPEEIMENNEKLWEWIYKIVK